MIENVVVYFELVVMMAPAMLIVVGLVTFSTKFGVSGKFLVGESMVLGIAAGIITSLVDGGGVLPITFSGWVTVIAAGVSLGLVTSLFHDELKAVAEKAFLNMIKAQEQKADELAKKLGD